MRTADVCQSHLETFLNYVDASTLILETSLDIDDRKRVVVVADPDNQYAAASELLPNSLINYFHHAGKRDGERSLPWDVCRYSDSTMIFRISLENRVDLADNTTSDSRRKPVTRYASGNTFWLALIFDKGIPHWLLAKKNQDCDLRRYTVFEQMLTSLSHLLRLMISHNSILTDPLTGLHSRAVLQSGLAGLSKQYTVGLVMLHCADLHAINQQYGPADGDKIITQTAEALTAITRERDIVCRFGGALFGVGFAVNEDHDAIIAAKKIHTYLQHQIFLTDKQTLRFNLGVAVLKFGDEVCSEREKISTLISRADQALRAAEAHREPTISVWKAGEFDEASKHYSYIGGIFTADTVTDYRNMLLLWDISSIIADENDFEKLLQKVIHRLAQSFDFIQAGLYGSSEVIDKAYTYEINDNDEAIAIDHTKPLKDKLIVALSEEVAESQKAKDFDDGHKVVLVMPLGIDTTDCFYVRSESDRFAVTRDTRVLLTGLSRQLGKALRRAQLEAQFNKQLVAQKQMLQHEVAQLREDMQSSSIVHQSATMQTLLRQAQRAAMKDTTVLITGESGTGKERLMNAVHTLSPRREKPFIIVDCGSIPEALIESELFGHTKGAFTGATRSTKGKILEANGGILALDEIGELPLAMQTKLLRFVQEKHFTPVGSADVINVDVKIIAVTNRDLSDDVAQGLFRKDLFYRLNVVTLKIPALRERTEDIPLLANHFLNRFAMQFENERKYLSKDALEKMQLYSWPGNVRELENKLMQASILLEGSEIQWQDLELHGDSRATVPALQSSESADKMTGTAKAEPQPAKSGYGHESHYVDTTDEAGHGESVSHKDCLQQIALALRDVVAETTDSHRFFDAAVGDWVEEEIVHQTYQYCQGNVKATAARLQLSLSTARRRINKVLIAVEEESRERPQSWPFLVDALRPLTTGQCALSNCFENIKIILLTELLNAEPGSMSQIAVTMGVSEPTLYKLKRKLRSPVTG